jgi:AraC-like DNA-binding protein
MYHMVASTVLRPTYGIRSRTVARFWQPFVRRDVAVICADVALDAVATHVHEGLLLVAAFEPMIARDGSEYETPVQAGQLLVVPPRTPVQLRRMGPGTASIGLLLVAPAGPEATCRDGMRLEGFAEQAVVVDRALHHALAALLAQLRAPLHGTDPGVLLGEVLDGARAPRVRAVRVVPSRRRSVPAGVQRLRALLEADPVRVMSLEELADSAALSKYHLLRTFQRAYGLTPHGYQMQLRLARARRLIEAGRALSFAAYDAGLADQSHLTRRFHDYFDLTPAAYARQVRRAVVVDDARAATPDQRVA